MISIYKKLSLVLVFSWFSALVSAQTVPQGVSYQAVMRDNTGQPLASQNVTVRFSIRQGAANGPIQWQENHTVTTNLYGLFTLTIGQGTNTGGGSLAAFSAIDWTTGVYFVEVEGDDGSGFVNLGTSQLLTVPYAMHAHTVEIDQVDDADNDPTNELQSIALNGNNLELSQGGGTVDLTPFVNTDEQTLTFDNVTGDLTIAGGNTINLPFSATGDNWGSQVVVSNATLNGNGTAGNPLSVNGVLTDNQTLSLAGSDLTISNGNTVTLPSAPVYTGGTGINVTGTTITNTAPDQTVVLNNGTGISVTGTYPNFTVTNTAPASSTTIVGGGITTVTGTSPNFTVSTPAQTLSYTAPTLSLSNGGGSVNLPTGTVSSVGLTAPTQFSVTGSPVTGTGTLGISWNSQAANTVLAAPSGAAGLPTFRLLAANDIPNLDASKITTGTLPLARGGTSAALTAINGGVVYSTGTAMAITPAGAAGQILQSNGAAAPTWVTAPTGMPTGTSGQTLRHDGTNWVANSNLFHNGTNVGVGTASPESKMHIALPNSALTKVLQLGHGNQPTMEWFFDVSATSLLSLRNEGNATPFTSMVWDANNGNVGIKTLGLPDLPLHIYGQETAPPNSGSVAAGSARFSINGSPVVLDMGIADDAYNGAWLQAHYSGNMATNSPILLNPNGGSVGINTTSPIAPLHVTGATQLDGTTQIGGSSGLSATLKVFSGLGVGTAYFFNSSNAVSMSVLSGGNVTIGNSTSVTKLFVQETNTSTTGTGNSYISLQNLANANLTTTGIRFRVGGTNAINGDFHYKGAIYFSRTGTNGEGEMIFALNNVASSANVTTSDELMKLSGAATTNGLELNKTTTTNAGYFLNTTTVGGTAVRALTNQNNATGTGVRYGVYAAGWYGQSTNYGTYSYGFGGTTAYGIYAIAGGATTNWAVYASGNAYSTGTWQTSDEKLKTQIQDYTNALSTIKNIPIKTYKYKTEEYSYLNLPKTKQYGFMAQDLEKVIPELVMDSKHDVLDGNMEPTGESIDIKVVNYDGLIPVLVRAIQEQQEQIEALKKEVEELKKK